MVEMMMLVVTAFLCGVMIFAAWEALITVRHDGGLDVGELVRSVQSLKTEIESRVKKPEVEPPPPPVVETKPLASASGDPNTINTEKVALPEEASTGEHSKVFHTTEEFFGHLTGES